MPAVDKTKLVYCKNCSLVTSRASSTELACSPPRDLSGDGSWKPFEASWAPFGRLGVHLGLPVSRLGVHLGSIRVYFSFNMEFKARSRWPVFGSMSRGSEACAPPESRRTGGPVPYPLQSGLCRDSSRIVPYVVSGRYLAALGAIQPRGSWLDGVKMVRVISKNDPSCLQTSNHGCIFFGCQSEIA